MSQALEQRVRRISALLPHIPRNLRIPALIDRVQRGLTTSQLLALFILDEAQLRGLSMSRIADELGVSLPTATGIVDRLVREGLVRRWPCLEDRRMVLIRLTSRGRQVARRLLKALEEVLTRVLSRLDEEEQETMVQAVERFYELSLLIREEDRRLSEVSA